MSRCRDAGWPGRPPARRSSEGRINRLAHRQGPAALDALLQLPPLTSSIAMAGVPSISSVAVDIDAVRVVDRSGEPAFAQERARDSAESIRWLSTFSATRRPLSTCSASNTAPMPPQPISRTMR